MMVAYRNGEKMKHPNEKRKMELPEGGEDKTQHKGDAGMGIYDNVSSLVCKRGEKTFVGSWMFSEPLDWDSVYDAWAGIISYCHRHNIVIGRHGERSNE